MKYSYTPICLLLIVACLVVSGEARGGRGRGGGSFGGIFGGWRSKYGSKSSSTGGGRRVISGSPVHTAMTVPKVPPPPPPPKPMSMPKPQVGNYPRQQLPPSYSQATGLSSGQGTYYTNAQALPSGAVYYPQSPMGMGSGTNGFLTGLLAGRLMDGMLFGRHHHVSHVYHQNQEGQATASDNGRQIIIVNNGQSQTEGTGEAESDPEQPINENPLTTEEEEQEEISSEEETLNTTAPQELPVGGIVCFPIMLNETDPQNPAEVREVERVVCFPAPSIDPQLVDCQNDPQCILELGGSSTTSTEPPIVAGDIGGAPDATEGEADGDGEEEEGEQERVEDEEVEEVTGSMVTMDAAQN